MLVIMRMLADYQVRYIFHMQENIMLTRGILIPICINKRH